MIDYQEHLLSEKEDARTALRTLDRLSNSISRTLFIISEDYKMVGSLTDGDIRRGLLNGLEISQSVKDFMNRSFKSLIENENNVEQIKLLKSEDLELIPLLDLAGRIQRIVDLTQTHTILPASALIMAGGRGERLRPFTDVTPKPMLKIGNKPIIEYNIDRLITFGISEIFISVKYLKDQIIDYFGDGSQKGISIKYIVEDEPLGTLGALSLINETQNDDILVMNSDLLTNIDFEDFFRFYKHHDADMAIASIPYSVNIPYAVLETSQQFVKSFIEKPTYTYYSNGGIYLFKFSLKHTIQKDTFFNATDLMDDILANNNKHLVHYPILCYWLDIGKHQDYIKAQEDIKYLNF